jgi:hypothetical protein
MIFRRLAILVTFAASVGTTTSAVAQPVNIIVEIPGQPAVVRPARWTPGLTVEGAMHKAGMKYVTGWFPGLGNALLIAEGIPAFTNGSLAMPFWRLCVDGKLPQRNGKNVGMSDAVIPSARSRVVWTYATDLSCAP